MNFVFSSFVSIILFLFSCSVIQNKMTALLRGHTGACYGAQFVENDTHCISWSSDCSVRLWDVVSSSTSSSSSLSPSSSASENRSAEAAAAAAAVGNKSNNHFRLSPGKDSNGSSSPDKDKLARAVHAAQSIPNFPILCGAWHAESKSLICGGGAGDTKSGGHTTSSSSVEGGADAADLAGKTVKMNRVSAGFSFIGTPIHVVGSLFNN
jgi:hypothetical protein